MITVNELMKWEKDIDILVRPYLVLCSPNQLDYLREQIGDKKFVFQSHPGIRENTVVVVDRDKVEQAWKNT